MPEKNFDYLVQPIGGLIQGVRRIPNHPGEPRFPVMTASLGDISQVTEQSLTPGSTPPRDGALDGAGSGLEEEETRVRAIAESLERYSTCVYSNNQFTWAAAHELGDEALDLDTIPRCSPTE